MLKVRQPGQGGAADDNPRDLRADLLAAEAAHFEKTRDLANSGAGSTISAPKRKPEEHANGDDSADDGDDATKRRRILAETRDIDADSEGSPSDSSEDESEEEDETAELMRELEKIKREKAEKKAKEDAEQAAREQDQREEGIALGNPLLNPQSFNVRRRWDDDVVFKNQARGTEQKGRKEFVNDLLRSDFHKKFMSKYVR